MWIASPGAENVLQEMDRVWGTTITTGTALAAHLNARRNPMLRTLGGHPFTRNMMTSLLRHLERYRSGLALRRHDESST